MLLALSAGVADADTGTGHVVWSEDPATHCRFVVPRSLPAGQIHWVGDCVDGRANGMGMLRRRNDSTGRQAFYGEMKAGYPVLGAIDTSDGNQGGYVAGRYVNGDLEVPEDAGFQLTMDAFDAAELAARKVAAFYRNAGNAASARFYEAEAQRLNSQIE